MRAAILILLACTVAAADPDPDAQRLLDEGTRLFTEDAKYEDAREAFEKSYAKEPSWRALNGVALTFNEQGRFVEALASYERLITEFDAVLTESQRATVKGRISALEAKVGTVVITAAQPGVAITIDSSEVGTGPLDKSIRVLPGRHVVVATKQGFRTLTRPVIVDAGQRLPVEVKLEAEVERIVVKTQPARMERRFAKAVPYTLLGSGGGLVLVGGVLHVLARRNFDKFDASVADMSGTPPMAVQGDLDARDRGNLELKLAIGAYVFGAAALITGGVIMAINQPRPVKDKLSIVPTANGFAVAGRF